MADFSRRPVPPPAPAVIFGAGFGQMIGSLAPGVDFIAFMYPGILAQAVLTSSLFAGVSVVWDREFGFLREILVAPIGRTGIVLGKAIGATVPGSRARSS